MEELYTKRLLLREWKTTDASEMFDYAKDPEVGPNAGWAPHKDVEESLSIIRMFRESTDEIYAIVLREDRKVIGSIGLHQRTSEGQEPSVHSRELGYVLARNMWGRGLVPEACARLILHAFSDNLIEEVWCGHYSFNERSRSVVLKSGFRYVETLKISLDRLDGREASLHSYRMTRDDFEKLKPVLLERAGMNCNEVKHDTWNGMRHS